MTANPSVEATHNVFAKRDADLLVYQGKILHVQNDIPALFAAMLHPVNQLLAALVLPFSRVQPCAAFIEHNKLFFAGSWYVYIARIHSEICPSCPSSR